MKKLIAAQVVFSILMSIGCMKREQTESLLIFSGTLEEVTIQPSDPLVELSGKKKALVYLPPGYAEDDTTTRYPVVYLLHGYGGDYRFWQDFEDISEIVDYLISTGEIAPLIIVMPDGMNPLGGSFYANSISEDSQDVFGRFEDYIVEDVVTYIDANFNTIDSSEKRGIIGISMGAYGALRLGFQHSDLFRVAGGHSGPFAFDEFLEEDGGTKRLVQWVREGLVQENPWYPISGDTITRIPSPLSHSLPDPDRPLTSMIFALASAFTPREMTLTGEDTLKLDSLVLNYDFMPVLAIGELWKGVLLPFDSLFHIKLDVWEAWNRKADILKLAEDYRDDILSNDLKIYFDCGDQDELHLKGQAELLHEKLDDLGISHTFEIFQGGAGFPPSRFPAGHGTHLYLRIRESLGFASQSFVGE